MYLYKGTQRKITLIYRSIFLFFCVTTLFAETYRFAKNDSLIYLVAYLTHLSFILTTLYLLVGIVHAWKTRPIAPQSILLKIINALFKITVLVQSTNTIAYWTVISWYQIPRYVNKCPSRLFCHYINFMTHLMPGCIAWFAALNEPVYFYRYDYLWFVGLMIIYGCIHIPFSLTVRLIYPPVVDFTKVWGYLVSILLFLMGYGFF